MDIETLIPREDVVGTAIRHDGKYIEVLYNMDTRVEAWHTTDPEHGYRIDGLAAGIASYNIGTSLRQHMELMDTARAMANLQD